MSGRNQWSGPSPLGPRFWAKVNKQGPNGCWEWQAAISPTGYGVFNGGPDRRAAGAHRIAYELLVGPIPTGLILDHLCRNRRCVNPAHLEPVTHGENILRGEGAAAHNARKSHCVHGHVLAGGNLYIQKGRKTRHCRTCRRDRTREWIARRAHSASAA